LSGHLYDRFDAKVSPEPNSGCWLWTAYCDRDGYGQFAPAHNMPVFAHRFSYERHRGKIPDGMQIDHLCRMRCCVNPDHLEIVTYDENTRRGFRKTKTHCIHGHSLADAYIFRGWRHCRECRRQEKRSAYRKRKIC
jgi:hypothetical protein